MFPSAVPLCAFMLLSMACEGAWAQRTVNRCLDAQGQTLLSDRPCVSAAPAAAAAVAEPGGRVLPARQRRLSAACTRLGDAIDSASLRGVRADVVSSMRTEYTHSCDAGDRR